MEACRKSPSFGRRGCQIKLNELDKLPILKDENDEQRDYFKKLATEYVVNAEKRYSNQSEFNYIVERGPNLKDVTY